MGWVRLGLWHSCFFLLVFVRLRCFFVRRGAYISFVVLIIRLRASVCIMISLCVFSVMSDGHGICFCFF